MNRELKARLLYFLLALVGVALLGAVSPWLKAFGSVVYVLASLAYLAMMWVFLNWLAHRIRTKGCL